MSNLPIPSAESISLLAAKESTLGTQPTAGWVTLQPNGGGVDAFYPKLATKAPSPLTRLRQLEQAQIVDLDASPAITHDLTKDFTDVFIEGALVAQAKHTGGTGLAYFLPTARTTTDFTVPALGGLQAGTLVFSRGWVNTANNGLFQVGSSSTGIAVKVAGGVAETVSGYVTTLEVAGFRFASGDLGVDVNGNFTTTVADFTTMGLVVGIVGRLGGTLAGTPGAHDFATAAYRGFFEVVSIAAHLLTVRRREWTVGAADAGTGKTIDLYWGRWVRNVATTDPDYLRTSYALEVGIPKLSAGTTDEFIYAAGCVPDQLEITAPSKDLVSAKISFMGTTIGNPTTTRATGGSTAASTLAIDRYNTVDRELYRRVLNQATEAIVVDDIESWKLQFMNRLTAIKAQGTLGTRDIVVGTAELSFDMTAFVTSDAALLACAQNTTLVVGIAFRNNDGGIFFNAPAVKCTDAPPAFPSNGPITAALKMQAFRDPIANYTLGVSLFPFLPAA